MYKYKEKCKQLNVSVPKASIRRKTIFCDESGQGKMPESNISFDSNNRYFIYTGTMFNNFDLKNFKNYYFHLKRKFFGKTIGIHATQFFRIEKQNSKKYIEILAEFLDSIPFLYVTVIVDKKKRYDTAKEVKIGDPFSTTLRKALSIYITKGLKNKDFFNHTVKDVFRNISEYSFRNIKNYYPLELAYRTILETYFDDIYPQLLRTKYKNWNKIKPLTELKFETSPNRQRILKYTESFRGENGRFGEDTRKAVYDISFPFKKAKYMGLEIADIISYGYNLFKYNRLNKTQLYKPIRKVILRKERQIKKCLGIDPVIEK